MIGINKRLIRIVVAFLLLLIVFNIFLVAKNGNNTRSRATSNHLLEIINYNSETEQNAQEELESSNYNGLKMALEEITSSMDETKSSMDEIPSKGTGKSGLDSPQSNTKTAKASSSAFVSKTSETASAALSTSSPKKTGSETAEVGAKGVIYNNKEDTSDAAATETTPYDAAEEFGNLVKIYPMILFSKSYCPFSKGMKDLLSQFDIIPALKIVELDTHENGAALQDYVAEKTGRKTVPNIIIPEQSLQSLGGFDDLKALNLDKLAKVINDACGDTCSIKQSKN